MEREKKKFDRGIFEAVTGDGFEANQIPEHHQISLKVERFTKSFLRHEIRIKKSKEPTHWNIQVIM